MEFGLLPSLRVNNLVNCDLTVVNLLPYLPQSSTGPCPKPNDSSPHFYMFSKSIVTYSHICLPLLFVGSSVLTNKFFVYLSLPCVVTYSRNMDLIKWDFGIIVIAVRGRLHIRGLLQKS